MRWLRRLWAWFVEWFRSFRLPERVDDPSLERAEAEPHAPAPSPSRPAFTVVHLTEEPDELLPETLYAIGENEHLWHVMFVCPCGCGDLIALNALPDASPRWQLHESAEGPTLRPSVWRTVGCRSHFILRRGCIVWCHGRLPDDVAEAEHHG